MVGKSQAIHNMTGVHVVPVAVRDVFYMCEKRKKCTHGITLSIKVEFRDPTGMMYFCIIESERLGTEHSASDLELIFLVLSVCMKSKNFSEKQCFFPCLSSLTPLYERAHTG
jgi:hypothetical protein